jgi:hypothetical protein
MKWRWKFVLISVLTLVALALLIVYLTKQYEDASYSRKTLLQAHSVLQACEAYRNDPANSGKKLPVTLTDLLRPSFTDKSFLRNGEADLLDRVGNPLRYAVVINRNGEQEVYVWGERIMDGQLKLVGAKRKANGEIEVFGHEE